MRRLALALVVAGLLAPAGAGATAASTPRIVAGTARASATIEGWFVARAVGGRPTVRTKATAEMRHGRQSQTVGRRMIPRLMPGERHRVDFSAALPTAPGIWTVEACIRTRCHRLGRVTAGAAPGPDTGPPTPLPLDHDSAPSPPTPEEPLNYEPGEPFHHTAGPIEYWGFVPYSYDPATPTPLLIWLHGCGGDSEGDIWVVDPGADPEEPQDWLTLALGGREGGCWDPAADEPKVLEALTNFESHFNVDHRRVILGGYSSGGDLAYRTGFRNSSTFAGLLIENSAPWSETEMSEAESLAAPTKFHVAHLAHTHDTTYLIATVREQTEAMTSAGFPVELIERPGGHSDANTDSDLRAYLLPYMDAGWLAP